MRSMRSLGLVFACLAMVLVGTGCGSNQSTGQVPDAQFHEKVRVFEADLMARSQDLETRLELLQGHGLSLADEAKDRWLEASEKYSGAQEAFKAKLQASQNQTPASWNIHQRDVNEAWASVEAAFEELKTISGKKE